MALFVAGLLVGGFAGSMPVLVAGRVLQGLGAGAIPAVAYVCIARGYPEACRPRMFALLSTAWVVPAVLGPGLAGWVGDAVGWRAVFWGLVPVVLVAATVVLVGIRHLPAGRTEAGSRLPLSRAFVVTAGAALVVAGLNVRSPLPAAALVVVGGALAVPAFVALTPPGTLRARPGLPAAVAARGVTTFAFFGAESFVPFALDELRGLSPGVAGTALTLAALWWTTGAWIQERTVERVGPRRLVRWGAGLLVVGLVAVALSVSPATPVALAYVAWSIAGLGMGLSFAPQSLVALSEAGDGVEGRATASLQLSDTLGVALGTGVAGAVVAVGESSGWALQPTLAAVFSISAAAAVLAAVVAGRLPTTVRGGRAEEHLTTAVATT